MADASVLYLCGKPVSRQDVLQAAARLQPHVGIRKYGALVDGRPYPPKRLVAEAAQMSTREFNSVSARRLLRDLGFEVGELSADVRDDAALGQPEGSPMLESLESVGRRLGFEVENEVQTELGRLDQVWWQRLGQHCAGLPARLAAVAFEVENGWRTRKHIKGDILNLATSGASHGVLVICGAAPTIAQLRDAACRFIKCLGLEKRITVWSEEDVARACQLE